MSRPVEAIVWPEIASRAGAALRRVDRWGLRGVTDLSLDEVEALALALAAAIDRLGPIEGWGEWEIEEESA